jgi:hypothetical protein
MSTIKSFLLLYILICLPSILWALPQDLDAFYDFENITAEGSDFTIGQAPFTIRVINFTLETVENPNLAHSGTKALVLVPGAQEGKILFERGANLVQFYAAETTGSGRLELRDKNFFSLSQQGLVEGLTGDISPGANPPLQSFVSFSGDSTDTTDLNYTAGIKEIKVVNVSGQFSIDDLGFTYVDGPPNNTVFEDFEGAAGNPVFANLGNFTLGQPPFTASFTGGVVQGLAAFPAFNHSFPTLPATAAGSEVLQAAVWIIINEVTGTITFETPALQVQFYAAVFFEGDGEIQVFDTNDNLLTSTKDIPLNINIALSIPFTFFDFNANELGAPDGIGKIKYINGLVSTTAGSFDNISLDDIGFTPIGAPGTGTEGPPPTDAPAITTQPASQEVQSDTAVALTVAASGDDLTYQWYTGSSGDTASPVAGATSGTLTTGALTVSTNYWAQITNAGGSADSDTAVITVAAPAVPLVLDGSGDIAGENIQHANGNVFDQILLTGESIQLQARPNQITRVSFMDETEDIVQVEFSGTGSFTVTLDPATFLPPAIPPRYNQAVEYVTGKPSVVIDGADANTFFSIFTVGRINAFNQALFPEGQVYDAQADVSLVEVVNSTGLGGVQLSNTVFSGSTGKVGVDARGVPIAVRLTVGDIDADGDAVPHLLFGEGSFTVPAGNPGLRITGGDLLQTNGASIVVAESGSTTPGFDILITQNNFKSDNTPQPTLSIDAAFANEDGDEITVTTEEITIE